MTDSRTSILAIHPGALGDVILFGHLLAGLGEPGESGQSARAITLVAGGEKARLLAGAGVVDAAMDFDSLPIHELFTDVPLSNCRLRSMLGEHERIVSCFVEAGSSEADRLVRMCGARELAALPIRPPADFEGHLTDLWRRQLGLTAPVSHATWNIPPSWRAVAAEALGGLGAGRGGRYVVIHPGAGATDKCWALERFVTVAAELRKAGVDVVFALGAVELDRWPGERISHLGEAGEILAGAPLTQLAGVLAGAAAFVGNDSGVAHLAGAVGTPTVALFGPTSEMHFSPLGRCVRCVAAETMDGIPVGRVFDTTRAIVDCHPRPSDAGPEGEVRL